MTDSSSLHVYVTDHSADGYPRRISHQRLLNLYRDIARDGIQAVRYDWRWSLIEPKDGRYCFKQLDRYGGVSRTMAEAGLQPPTIILSSLPKWALKLYKEGKRERFMAAWRAYALRVRRKLELMYVTDITRVQVLNELNNRMYSPIALDDLPQLVAIVREVFEPYNPNLQIMATLLASNRPIGTPIMPYLDEFEAIADCFNIVGIDYYPGLWHWKEVSTGSLKPSQLARSQFCEMRRLSAIYQRISGWGKAYELSETGFPSRLMWGGEKNQRIFYSTFLYMYRMVLVSMQSKNMPLPSGLGFYAAIDERPRGLVDKLLRTIPLFPEYDMGMRYADGSRKLVLRPYDINEPWEPSALSELISSMHTLYR